MIRFIHAADIHLDSPLKGLEQYEGAPVDDIRGATRRALENLVQLAIDREVDLVLIAGDLYDGDWKDHNTGLFFVGQMHRLRNAQIPVVLIAGNHDAANKMTRSLRLPDNVELLGHTRPSSAKLQRLADLGIAVHGQSFGKAAEFENLVPGYPTAMPGMFNIGVLHTSLTGAEGHEPYAPCTLDELRHKSYSYWALGHVHSRSVLCEDPPIVFPGNIQGRHIREPGAKGCYIVEADDQGRCDLEFHPLDVLRWQTCEIDATGIARPEDLLDRFSSRLEALCAEHSEMTLAVRVEVAGRTDAQRSLLSDPVRWTNELRALALGMPNTSVWVEKVKWRIMSPSQLTGAADTSGPIGSLMNYLAELRDNESALSELSQVLDDLRAKLPDELRHGDDALRVDDPLQLRRWLDDVQPMLLTRLEGV